MTNDIRWQQRFSNYKNALGRLRNAVALSEQRELNDLEKQGLIQAFEFTHELAWKVLKDYFEHQGSSDITGSRDASKEAFERGLIKDGEAWMDMIISRNQSSHTYHEATAEQILTKIIGTYHHSFVQLEETLTSRL